MTVYRDEREAQSAHIEQLESELDEARAEIDRLRRGGDKDPSESSPWLGGPTLIEHQWTHAGELPDAALEEIVEILRLRLGQVGRAESVGKSFAWRTEVDPQRGGRRVEVLITRRGGKTRFHVIERLGMLAGGLFGGVVGGAGGGGLATIVGVTLGTGVFFPFGLAGAALWLGLTYGIVRTSFAAVAKSRTREIFRLKEEIDEIARDALSAPAGVQARVAEDEAEGELEAELAFEPAEAKTKR